MMPVERGAMPEDDPTSETISTRCCIVGGGPAGMMCGYLLARAGIDVVVLEKHADFLRDFRGDTVHPSTLQVMNELGILDEFLKRARNHDRLLEIRANLVVGTDGRHSTMRARAGFQVMDIGAPMDGLWMRISRLPG